MAFNTFSTALSGLATNTQGLNVVGNNLANLNTVAYKAANISFMEVLGQKFSTSGTEKSGSSAHIGLGSQIGRVNAAFTQGGLETTNNPTDVAIQGRGFFAVSDGVSNHFTRAGNFHVDADGHLVTANGQYVQGYVKDPITGEISTKNGLANIKIPSTTGNATPTTEFELAFNLDASKDIGDSFSTTVQLYDSMGQARLATVSFVKDSVAAGETKWRFDVTVPHKDFEGVASTSTDSFSLITGAVAADPPAAGALVFDSTGRLKSSYLGADPATLPDVQDLALPPSGVTLPTLKNGGVLADTGIEWKLIQPNGDYYATNLAATSDVTFSTQNGVPPGNMNSLLIQSDGALAGVFSNGLTLVVGKIALATFNNENGLLPQGKGLFAESAASGSVVYGTPGEAGRGSLVGGALESSNVDLATEFTKIITFQRGYQANARLLTATDQILQETMNLRQ